MKDSNPEMLNPLGVNIVQNEITKEDIETVQFVSADKSKLPCCNFCHKELPFGTRVLRLFEKDEDETVPSDVFCDYTCYNAMTATPFVEDEAGEGT